jgi:hypothetical protein
MKIIVEKRNNRYFAIIKNINSNIPKKIIITKSWDSTFLKEKILNYDILNNELNIKEKSYDLLNFEIELEPISNFQDYYKFNIITDNGISYPFYIDYNLFYNISVSDFLYFYEFKTLDLVIDENFKYDFFILGNFGDKHLIRINKVIGNKILFNIPKKETLNSEFYYIVVEKNGEKILKDYFGIYIDKHPINFIIQLDDFGEYYKCSINTKHKYNIIKKLSIEYDKKTFNVLNNYSTYFFISKNDFKKPIELKINATIQEDYINSKPITKNFLILKDLINKKQIEITNFQKEYNFQLDTYSFNWNVNILENFKYKIVIGNEVIYSDLNYISVNNFKKYDNGLSKINLEFYIGTNNKYFLLDKKEIENPYFIYKSQNFIPEIDYSGYVNSKEQFGIIKWTIPNYKYYSMISFYGNISKSFLDENIKPWILPQELILEKNKDEFSKRYNDLNKIYNYDFENGKETLNGIPSNSSISYKTKENNFIFVGTNNYIKIPKIFLNSSEKIKFKVKILDAWFKEQGENFVEFKIPTTSNPLLDDDIRFIRNQNIQFGENGTIGIYNSLKNIGPLEVEKFYGENKTFLETPLFDKLNTDLNNVSLYYYLNTNYGKTLDLKIKRSSNHKSLKYKIIKDEKEILAESVYNFIGDNFNENVIKIQKNIFKEEGKYSMILKTINPYEVESEEKIINFYVYNEKPKQVVINIPEEQHRIEDGKIVINRKYFSIDVINNSHSKKYSGWEFKEVHFYFRENSNTSTYNNYPDYVIQASKEYGTIKMINKTPFENGEYKCKIVAYDYSGNEGIPYEFEFKLISEMIVRPEKELTNKINEEFKFEIKKAEDSDGYFYVLAYSPDGIQEYQYENNFTKIEDSYYLNNPSTNEWTFKNVTWLKDSNHKVKLGYYKLIVNEWNYKNPDGVLDKNGRRILFESTPVIVNKTGNQSNPIYSKNIDGKVKVYNNRKSNEYSYTNNLNNLEFSTVHDEPLIEESPLGKTENEIKGKFYKIELISPDKNKIYSTTLPIPTAIGNYTFTDIAKACKINNQEEGIWELRFITRDKFGNINNTIGYYSYKIILVTREPKIISATPNNNNTSEYFSSNDNKVSYIVDTFNYSDIPNVQNNYDYFKLNNFYVNFLSTPLNSQYKTIREKNSNNIVDVIETITTDNKNKHDIDGRYLIDFVVIDPLGRQSLPYEKTFYIDTKLEYDISFLNNDKFFKKNITLYASVSNNVNKIYYKFLNDVNEINNIELSENINYKIANIESISYGTQNIYGFKTEEFLFEKEGYKYLAYWVEEKSGNISKVQFYKFFIDSNIKLIPIFDYNNKVYYTLEDGVVNISWNSTNKEVNEFSVKLDKIEKNQQGEYEIVESYIPLVNDNTKLTGVGASNNSFIDIGNKKYFSFEYNDYTSIREGLYRLTVKGKNTYGTTEENSFIFQISYIKKIDLSNEIINNKITLSSNKISWKYIDEAEFYEVSYDNKNFISTNYNYFIIDESKLVKEKNGNTYIYLRYKNKMGITEESVRILINNSIKIIKDPIIETDSDVLINNSSLIFTVKVENPEQVNFIYYSFNKKDWFVKPIEGVYNSIENENLSKPIKDGNYDVFVMLTDENPINNVNYSKSNIIHKSIKMFSEKIEKPKFSGIENGSIIKYPKNLYIENKRKDVEYFIYVNERKVNEGYELSSSTLRNFNIEVKAKKKGRNELINLISYGDLTVQVSTGENYILNVSDEKIICNVDTTDNTLEIIGFNNLKSTQIVMYKEKNEENWKVLNISVKLNLNNEYEFKIINFKVNNVYE